MSTNNEEQTMETMGIHRVGQGTTNYRCDSDSMKTLHESNNLNWKQNLSPRMSVTQSELGDSTLLWKPLDVNVGADSIFNPTISITSFNQIDRTAVKCLTDTRDLIRSHRTREPIENYHRTRSASDKFPYLPTRRSWRKGSELKSSLQLCMVEAWLNIEANLVHY